MSKRKEIPEDQPFVDVQLDMSQRLHDTMKELAKRKRIRLPLVYEHALCELIDQLESGPILDPDDRKRVNIKIDAGIHKAARDMCSMVRFYSLAAIQYLNKPENYLGENYMEIFNNGHGKEEDRKKGAPQDNRRGNRQTRKTR